MIDGEVVAVDEEGRSSFQLLQGRELPGGKDQPVFFYVFDLLQAGGRSLLSAPLDQRKAWLEQLCGGAGEPIRYSAVIGGDPAKLLAEVQRRGLEGLIGKQRHSIYEPDRRSGLWIKLKVLNEQEFVIGGYTPPAGCAQTFRRRAGRLLRKESAAFRRAKSGRASTPSCSRRCIGSSRPERATIVLSPISPRNKTARGSSASRHR